MIVKAYKRFLRILKKIYRKSGIKIKSKKDTVVFGNKVKELNLTDKLKIITIFDKHEDFIELQYHTIIKHIKGDYEYIIFNNASTEDQVARNKNICDKLGIKCIRIKVDYDGGPSDIAGEALNESFAYLSDSAVFKIDSDMFFTADIKIEKLFEEADLIYIPNYRTDFEMMWSGVFGINLKKIDLLLDFRPAVFKNTDTFGQSALLTRDVKYKKKRFQLYNIQDTSDGVLTTSLNNDCLIKFKDGVIIEKPYNIKFFDDKIITNLVSKYNEIIKTVKLYGFPEPYNLDIIEIDGSPFMIHFKSSNWCPWYTEAYVVSKKEALKKMLN